MDRPPYQVVLRLYGLAENYWEMLDYHYHQINLIGQPPHRFCNLIYGWAKALTPPDKWDQFEFELAAPIPGRETTPSETEIEEEGRLFLNAMNTLEM